MALIELFYQKQLAELEHPTEDSIKDKILKFDENSLFDLVADYNKANGFAEVSYKINDGVSKKKFFDSSAKFFTVRNCSGIKYLDSADSLFDFVSVEELEAFVKDDAYQTMLDEEEITLKNLKGKIERDFRARYKSKLEFMNKIIELFSKSGNDYLKSVVYELKRLRDIYETKRENDTYKSFKRFALKSLDKAKEVSKIKKVDKESEEYDIQQAGHMTNEGKKEKKEYRSLYKNNKTDIERFDIDKQNVLRLELAPKTKKFLEENNIPLTFAGFYALSGSEKVDEYFNDIHWRQALFQLKVALDKYVKKEVWEEDLKKLKATVLNDLENVFDIIFKEDNKFKEFTYKKEKITEAKKTTALNRHKSKIETLVKNAKKDNIENIENQLNEEKNKILELKDKFLGLKKQENVKAINKFKGELITNLLKK